MFRGKRTQTQNLACFVHYHKIISGFFPPRNNMIMILKQIVWETQKWHHKLVGPAILELLVSRSNHVKYCFDQQLKNSLICAQRNSWHHLDSANKLHSRRGHLESKKGLIEGFHVTSYLANFASHHTHDRHVGFLLARQGKGKRNKMSRYFLFSSYHNTKS